MSRLGAQRVWHGRFVQEFVDLLAFDFQIVEVAFMYGELPSCLTSARASSFFTQFHILLLKGFNHMIKDFVPCAVSVYRFRGAQCL